MLQYRHKSLAWTKVSLTSFPCGIALLLAHCTSDYGFSFDFLVQVQISIFNTLIKIGKG